MYLRQFCIDDIYVYNHAWFSGFVMIGIAYVFDLVGECNKRRLEFTDLSRDQEVSSIANGVVIHCKEAGLSRCVARQALRRFLSKKYELQFRYYHGHRPKALTGMDGG